jgi:cytochrome d ubiquinol oxidase subunit II
LPQQHPFHPALVGGMTVALFALHGALFLQLKTEGPLLRRTVRWSWIALAAFLALYAATTALTLATVPRALANFERFPLAWLIVAISLLAIADLPRALARRRPLEAFAASCATIASLVGLLGIALFPSLVPAADGGPGLTIYDAASSPKTLGIMAIVAAIGMPFVLVYTVVIYWTFRGKVRAGGY